MAGVSPEDSCALHPDLSWRAPPVERFFAELTSKRLRRGAFRSVRELVKAIEAYVEHHNDTTTGFAWTNTADAILSKVARAKATLGKINDSDAVH